VEQLNWLFHEVGRFEIEAENDEAVMRLVAAHARARSVYGVTETTLSRYEGWRFGSSANSVSVCAVSMLLDAYFTDTPADDLDWVALLASCAAFDRTARCSRRTCSRLNCVPVVHPEFPYSVRYSVERMQESLTSIIAHCLAASGRIERIMG
jgi:uncharacterized alpha-E superfamily protein